MLKKSITKMRAHALCVFFLLSLFMLSGCTSTKAIKPISKTSFLIDTVVTISLYDKQDQKILDECFELIKKYENQLSKTVETSEIYQLNATGSAEVSDNVLFLMKKAIHFAEISDGALDISIGAATSLWDFKADFPRVPTNQEVTAAVKTIGYQDILIAGNRVTLKKPGMQIDLGAIAKGYIADEVANFLREKGITSAIINLGGNVFVVGEKAKNTPFSVGLQAPFKTRDEVLGQVKISNRSVVTSGIYEKYFEIDGVFYHHILDPKTGMPVSNDLNAVCVISDSSADGDALTTVCYVLGAEKAMPLIESLPNVEALFMLKDGTIIESSGMKKIFTPAKS